MKNLKIGDNKFASGLNKKGVSELSDFMKTRIGKKLLGSERNGNLSYQMFFRDNNVDFYWHGCRILRYKPLGAKGKNRFTIDARYINRSNTGIARLRSKDGDLVPDGNTSWSFYDAILKNRENRISTLKPGLKGSSEEKQGEKDCFADYVDNLSSPILDVEAALPVKEWSDNKKKDQNRRKRVDMVRWNNSRKKLEFIEVKLHTYVAALRAEIGSDRKPKVIAQLKQYEDFLSWPEKRTGLIEGYNNVLSNILELGLEERYFSPSCPILKKGKFEENDIDRIPHLLILKAKDEEWTKLDDEHFEILEKELGKDHIDVSPEQK